MLAPGTASSYDTADFKYVLKTHWRWGVFFKTLVRSHSGMHTSHPKPAPLLLAEKGIMEGRKCSGRPRSIDEQTKRRFIEIVKASCDPSSQGFIFITRKAGTIKNYHHWLEQERGRSISLAALRRCAKRENLKLFLEKPDFEGDESEKYTFKPEPNGSVYPFFVEYIVSPTAAFITLRYGLLKPLKTES